MLKKKMAKSSSFAQWVEAQDKEQNSKDGDKAPSDQNLFTSMYLQVQSVQDNLVNQIQDMTASLPEAGPLSAAYRGRIVNAIYLILASAFFAAMAILIGLPTIVLKPSKFVMCLTLSSGLAAASIAVLQKPSEFLRSLLAGGLVNALPALALLGSMLLTFYVTVFIHRYIHILFAGGLQVLCMFYYLASFVPGGTQGLTLLLRASYMVLSTLLSPFIFITKKTTGTIWRQIFS